MNANISGTAAGSGGSLSVGSTFHNDERNPLAPVSPGDTIELVRRVVALLEDAGLNRLQIAEVLKAASAVVQPYYLRIAFYKEH